MAMSTEQMLKNGNGSRSGNVPLEERLTLNFASEDNKFIDVLTQTLQKDYRLSLSTLRDIMGKPVVKLSDVYLMDLLSLPEDVGYDSLIEKIKYAKSIRPESKAVILATTSQQANKSFNLFKEVSKYGLVEIVTRPDSSKLTESRYTNAITHLSEELPNLLRDVYNKNGKLENTKIVKIGGSIFDLYDTKPRALHNLLGAIVKAKQGHCVILTVGGGPVQGFAENYRNRLRISSDEAYEKLSEAQLTYQAKTVADLLEQIEPGIAVPIPIEHLGFMLIHDLINSEFLRDKIPIVSLLPEISTEKLQIPKIPSSNSDVHTVYFADSLGIRKIIFAKDTDGIYLRDPYLSESQVSKLRAPFRGENIFFDYIFADSIQKRIERKGLNPTGQVTDEHLIETPAIEPFMSSKSLYTIQIVNGTKPQEVVKAMNGIKAGSYILK